MKRALFLLPALVMACGGAPESNDSASSTEEDLSAFASKMAIVGNLPNPEGAVHFTYSAKPLYRAIQLHGQVGDWVKMIVRPEAASGSPKVVPGTPLGDPLIFLLDSQYTVIAKNHHAVAGTPDSQIVVRLQKSGTFYLAVRDYSYRTMSFGAELSMARAGGGALHDANTWFAFFIAGDAYGGLVDRYALPMNHMPATAQADANGFFKTDVGNASGYALPYGHGVMYMLTGSAEEAYDARPYDSAGNPIAPIAIGGAASDINFTK